MQVVKEKTTNNPIYAGLVVSRFFGRQVGRPAAASAVGGFAFLLFAVVGVELLA